MIKQFVFLCFFLLECFSVTASEISNSEKYSLFCRIYGLTKYNSNQLIKDKIDWETHTLNYLRKLEDVPTNKALDSLVQAYLSPLSTPKPSKKTNQEFLKMVNYDWIQNTRLGENNKLKLQALAESFLELKHTTFRFSEKKKVIDHVGNTIKFDTSPDEYTYLLGYMQLWNIIEYFYPHKNLNGENFSDSILNEICTYFETKDRIQYINNIKHIVALLKDSHGFVKDLTNKTPQNFRHAIGFSLIEGKVSVFSVLNDSLKQEIKIKRGDILTHINGVEIDSVFAEYQYYNSHSNPYIAKYYFARQLPFFLKDSCVFTFNDTTTVFSKRINFSKITLKDYYENYHLSKDINKDIAYIFSSEIGYFAFGKVLRKFKKKKYLIFDCRGYSSLAMLRYGKLLGGQPKIVAKYFYPYYKKPGYYISSKDNYFGNSLEIGLKLLGLIPSNTGQLFPSFRKTYKGQVIILINERAVSFGETNIMALKTYSDNSILVGTNTTGANGNVCTIKLHGDIEIGFTGIDFRFADDTKLQQIGIKPQYFVEQNLEDFIAGEDAVLKFVIKNIKDKVF